MTSEIRVNKLTNRIGLSTVTFADSGIGVTVTGRIDPDTDSARDLGTTSVRWRNAYVDTYYGDGSNLTGITETTINSNTNNYLITGTGTANTLQGESNLTWDGNSLDLTAGTGNQFPIQIRNDFTPNSQRSDYASLLNATSNNTLRLGSINSNGGATIQVTRGNDSSIKHDLLLQPDGGNVGVNYTSTQNWGAKFRVGGLLLSDQGAGSPYVFGKLSSAQDFVLGRTDVSGNLTEMVRLKAGGEVGINMTPSNGQMLAITGRSGYDDIVQVTAVGTNMGARINLTNTGTGVARINATNNSLALQTVGVERLRINSDGQLLVGNSASGFTTKLVVGTGSGENGITVYGGTSNNTYLHFADGNSGSDRYRGYVNYSHSDNSMQFGINDVEKVRINSTGLMIGTSTQVRALTIKDPGQIHVESTATGNWVGMSIKGSSGTNNYDAYFGILDSNGKFFVDNGSNGNDIEIESSASGQKAGRVLVGPSVPTSGDDSQVIIRNNEGGGIYRCLRLNNQSNNNRITMTFEGGGTQTGDIRLNGSTTSYNSYSDYRLKENVVPLTDPITRLKTLKPYRFNFIASPHITLDGFFAHEVSPAVAEAVGGEKDEVDKDGNVVPQALDMAKLVPLLTASLQEAITKIETLEQENIALRARVTNLEGN